MARVQLDRDFAELIRQLQADCARVGIRVVPQSGFRSIARQRQIVAAVGLFSKGGGAAAPGNSFHNYGLALDVDISPKRWDEFGRIAEALGLRWGGRWRPKREPWHVDLGAHLSIADARRFFNRAYLMGVS